jgi:hypothetical protein
MIREPSSTEKCCQFVINFTKGIKYSIEEKFTKWQQKRMKFGENIFICGILILILVEIKT